MIKTNEFVIWFPYDFTPIVKVEINGIDLSKYVKLGEFIRRATTGIGVFSMTLNNTNGVLSNTINRDDEVVFYGDTSNASTVKFKGNIDGVYEDLKSRGQFIRIEGRHKSFKASETYISYSAINKDGASILKEIVDEHLLPLGFNYTEVSIGKSITVNWDKKPFLECVRDLCILCGADYYIDDDLVFHFFKENSIFNRDEAVMEGQTLIELRGFGIDGFEKRDKITTTGKDNAGLPILYTSGTGDRQKLINDTSINTMSEAEDRSTSEFNKLQESELVPTGTAITKGMCSPTQPLQVGDNVFVFGFRQKVQGVYKVIAIKDRIGRDVGTWISELTIEKKIRNLSNLIEKTRQKELELTTSDNPFNMEYSYNFEFDNEINIDGTESNNILVEDGFLKTNESTAKMVSLAKNSPILINSVHIKVVGENLENVSFRVSPDNGVTWKQVTREIQTPVNGSGKLLVVEVKYTSSVKLDSLDIMWK